MQRSDWRSQTSIVNPHLIQLVDGQNYTQSTKVLAERLIIEFDW